MGQQLQTRLDDINEALGAARAANDSDAMAAAMDRAAALAEELRSLRAQRLRFSQAPHSFLFRRASMDPNDPNFWERVAETIGQSEVVEFDSGLRVYRNRTTGEIEHEWTAAAGEGRQHLERGHWSAGELRQEAERERRRAQQLRQEAEELRREAGERPDQAAELRRRADELLHEAERAEDLGRIGRPGSRSSGPGYERAHASGQGTGPESPYAIYDAPSIVNQDLQNQGIEALIRRLRDACGPGESISIVTSSAPHPGTRRLKHIEYHISIRREGEILDVGEYRIEVSGTEAHPLVEAAPFSPAENPQANSLLSRITIPDILTGAVSHQL